MQYKGLNKIYFGIGMKPSYANFLGTEIFFYFFKLKKLTEGEILKRGRDYDGFYFTKTVYLIPNFKIEL